ncbi:acyltransferase [Companilactobacillus furfuricola]|uniref:acyltransferase n=1 Tax=Companilactobacillus furfuricola TaxID=1462575 RepID=UPI000F7A7BFF|nr:acyltransferase [Companilactobacillus furfuricola]
MSKRIAYIDYLKITAMLGVVMSHSLAATLSQDPLSPAWHLKNIAIGLVSPAVGIFYFVSGALILSSQHTDDLKYLWTHRLVKIFIPFLIWSIVTIAVLMHLDHNFSIDGLVKEILLIYHKFPIVPYWFLYPLLGFYLISPMIKAFVDKATPKVLDYIIGVWFVTNMLLPYIVSILPHKYGIYFTANPQYNLIFLGQTFGYFILGYRISKQPLNPKAQPVNIAATTLLFLFTIVMNAENVAFHLNIPVIGFSSIFSLLLATELFITVRTWARNHQHSIKNQQRFALISSLSYGVYLTHGLVIQVIEEIFKITNAFAVFGLTTVICLLFCYIVSKIPKVRFILLGIS